MKCLFLLIFSLGFCMSLSKDTKLLCHFNNHIGDDSFYRHDIAANGSVALSSGQSKFGNKSLVGTESANDIDIAYSAQLIPPGDFTMECFIHYDTAEVDSKFWLQSAGPGNNISFVNTSGTFSFVINESSTTEIDISGDPSVSADTWYHVAVTRFGDVWSIYFDGTRLATVTKTYTYPTHVADVIVRPRAATSGDPIYIDELRFLNGAAAYTGASYTVPTQSFPIGRGGRSRDTDPRERSYRWRYE